MIVVPLNLFYEILLQNFDKPCKFVSQLAPSGSKTQDSNPPGQRPKAGIGGAPSFGAALFL
jgi:hypothetical protein